MTRVALISDQHFDRSSRWEECLRVTSWIAEDVARRKVQLVLLGGDLFERRSIPEERNAAASWVRELARTAAVVGVYGNHDAAGDLDLLPRLRTHHPVAMAAVPTIYVAGGAAVACLPWPRKAALLASVGSGVGHEEMGAAAQAALGAVLRGLGDELAKHAGPRLVLAHAMVRGSRTSVGQPLVGCDMEIGLEDLALARTDAYCLGHIHMPQDWKIDAAPVIYAGSPRRTAYGEVESKGYVLLECDGHAVEWKRIETPCAPMVLVETRYDEERVAFAPPPHKRQPAGAEIRLRYTVASDHRAAARVRAEETAAAWKEAGAAEVKLDERVVAVTRSRASAVAVATTLEEKLRALWIARQTTPEDTRAARLLSRAASLESAASAA